MPKKVNRHHLFRYQYYQVWQLQHSAAYFVCCVDASVCIAVVATVLHVKPSCNNSNLNGIGISLQRADFLVTETKIFRIIWKKKLLDLENLHKIWWGETYHCRSAIESITVSFRVLIKEKSTTILVNCSYFAQRYPLINYFQKSCF